MKTFFLLSFVLFNSFLFTQHKHSKYVGEEKRSIKSLSDEDIQNLKEGNGMGLAKAAELNHYPGPKHVFDIADVLKITDEQKNTIQTIFKTMSENAVRAGNKIIMKEKELDSLFASNSIDEQTLKSNTEEIGILHGELRSIHLIAHVATKKILTAEQVAKYDEARGYIPKAETKKHKQHKMK
ncbi:MAG: hypothetical protein FJ218_00555 [Ignavibacteria bacterium]|nr:hypothetical protein [Ignavibacteria bacterium]